MDKSEINIYTKLFFRWEWLEQALSRAFHSILNGYLSNTGFIYRDEQTLQFNAGKSFQIECGRRMRPEDFDYRRWFKPRMENDNEFYKKNGVKLTFSCR